MLKMSPPPSAEETRETGFLPFLVPFPRFELGQPGNPLRVFERGGRRRLESGLPGRFASAGHLGQTQTSDPTIPRDESGHPLKHQFTLKIVPPRF
jgi:hypothetical protein